MVIMTAFAIILRRATTCASNPEGEIDFLVVAPVLADVAPERRELPEANGQVLLLPDAEILAQKLYYRAVGFTGRDLYDFVAVTAADPTLVDHQGLKDVARLRRDALEMSLASAACEIAYAKVDRPTFDLSFVSARDRLLDWLAT